LDVEKLSLNFKLSKKALDNEVQQLYRGAFIQEMTFCGKLVFFENTVKVNASYSELLLFRHYFHSICTVQSTIAVKSAM
jgi:hypothetical protein